MATVANLTGKDDGFEGTLESLLVSRRHELGIGELGGRSLGRELALNHGLDVRRGRGLGI